MTHVYLHWNEHLTSEHTAAGLVAHRGHPSNPFDEPLHEGHMVKLIAPNYPLVYHDPHGKSGHYYTSVEEPDPFNPGQMRLVAFVWPGHVAELLRADPPYRLPAPDEAEVAQQMAAQRAAAEAPAAAESTPKGKKGAEGGE